MKPPAAVAVAVLGSVVGAHTLFTTLFINGKNQGDGTCVRMPRDSATANGPVYPLTGDDMARGRDGGEPVAFTCAAPRGATLTFEFRMYSAGEQAGAIAPDHKGPCAVYVKKVDDMQADRAAGPGWFKVWEYGYDAGTGKWCVDRLIDQQGLLSVRLPAGLPAGYYLVRPELLALHRAAAGDAQFYVGCAQVFVDEGPRQALEVPRGRAVSIPGHVDAADAGLRFDLQRVPLPAYPMPGPDVYVPTAAAAAATTKLAQGQGAVPGGCLIKNANWCGARLEAHSDRRGCWAAVDECYGQSQRCWAGAPPSGDANCGVWQAYCREAEAACQAGRLEGPPSFTGRERTAAVPGEMPEPWTRAPALPTPDARGAADGPPKPTRDGRCGGEAGQTCRGGAFGDCCSRRGWCGGTAQHCGEGCQGGSARVGARAEGGAGAEAATIRDEDEA